MVRKNSNKLSNQIKNLANLVRRDLSLSRKKKKVKQPKRKSGRTRIGVKSNGVTLGEVSFHHSPACQQLKGVALAAAAQFAPFDIPRGVANVLSNSMPSQKFSSRGFMTYDLPASGKMMGFCTPNICNNSLLPSLVCIRGGTEAQYDGCQPFLSGGATTGITVNTMVTQTPYNESTLSDTCAEFRLVSCGLRIKNTSNVMNRGGTLIYFVDTNETLTNAADDDSTLLTITDRILGSAKSVRVPMATQPICEIVGPHKDGILDSQSQTGWATISAARGIYDATYAGSLSGTPNPSTYSGYGQIFFHIKNTTGVTQSFDIELVEHWEVIYPGIEQLATPSVSHESAYSMVKNIAHQALQTHSNHPSLSIKSVIKEVAKMTHNKEVMKGIGGLATAVLAL